MSLRTIRAERTDPGIGRRDVQLPTGELIAAADIEGMPDAPTIPSEFADALDV